MKTLWTPIQITKPWCPSLGQISIVGPWRLLFWGWPVLGVLLSSQGGETKAVDSVRGMEFDKNVTFWNKVLGWIDEKDEENNCSCKPEKQSGRCLDFLPTISLAQSQEDLCNASETKALSASVCTTGEDPEEISFSALSTESRWKARRNVTVLRKPGLPLSSYSHYAPLPLRHHLPSFKIHLTQLSILSTSFRTYLLNSTFLKIPSSAVPLASIMSLSTHATTQGSSDPYNTNDYPSSHVLIWQSKPISNLLFKVGPQM